MVTLRSSVAAVALVTTALVASLAGCSSAPPIEPKNAPTMAPEQSLEEACDASRAEVETLIDEVKTDINEAGTKLASGEIPDMAQIFADLPDALDSITEPIRNPEALEALDKVHVSLEGFTTLSAPDSLAGVPAYLASLTTQLGELTTSGTQLARLCGMKATQ